MDEKIKTWPLRFSAKKTLVWRRHCSIGQSCCSMTSKRSIYAFLRVLGHEIFSPERRLTNQKPRAFNIYPFDKTIKSFYFCSFVFSYCSRVFISRSYENCFNLQWTWITSHEETSSCRVHGVRINETGSWLKLYRLSRGETAVDSGGIGNVLSETERYMSWTKCIKLYRVILLEPWNRY